MCTPWTLSKLMRCRRCFSPSSGAEQETETAPSAVATYAGNESIAKGKANRRTVFRGEPIDATLRSTRVVLPDEARKYELRWHRSFEDERYIVLCFGKEESVADGEDDIDKLDVPPDSGNDSGGLSTVSQESLEDEGGDSSVGSMRSEFQAKVEEHTEISPTVADQSERSNGHGSKGSFSFPVLQEEWIGSPIQMPRPKGLRLRNNSSTHVCVQCCKF